jgi:Sulfotransferase domain
VETPASSRLPDFVVIGAMKSGTTSLHHYLSLHPEIEMSVEKEPTFFTTDGSWSEGVGWYASRFQGKKRLLGEASPDYTKAPRHSGVPARMHSVLPDAKLVYLVRDPVNRILSHYADAFSFGRVHKPLDDILDDETGRHFVACSKYFFQLEQYLPYYDPARILVVATEELASRRTEVLARIFGFLGADATFTDARFSEVHYRREQHRRKTRIGYAALEGARRFRQTAIGQRLPRDLARPIHAYNRLTAQPVAKPQLSTERREELLRELRPDIERLRKFTGQTFPDWSVSSEPTRRRPLAPRRIERSARAAKPRFQHERREA